MIALIAVLILACVAVPFVVNPHLPLVDLPNHIARLHIARSDGPLTDYYDYALTWAPNQAADWAWAALGGGAAEPFANALMAIYAVLLPLSVWVLGRVASGGWTTLGLAAGLLVFNLPLWWGFQNYLITVPFAIFALALWLRAEAWPPLVRIAVFVPICFALFFMHLFAFAVFAAAAAGREVQRLVAERSVRSLVRTLGQSLPFLGPIGVLGWGIVTGPPNPNGTGSSWPSLAERLQALGSAFGRPGELLGADAAAWGLCVMILVTILVGLRQKSGPRLRFERRLVGPAIALALLAIAAPSALNGVAFVHIRFPFVALAVLFAGLRLEGLTTAQIRLACLALLALVAVRSAQFHLEAQRYSQEIATLNALAQDHIPPGARVLAIRDEGMSPDTRHWHSVAHLVPQTESFVPTLFQGVHNLRLKPEWNRSAIAAGIPPTMLPFLESDAGGPLYFHGWPSKFTHVILLDAAAMEHRNLTQVEARGRFTLYEVKP